MKQFNFDNQLFFSLAVAGNKPTGIANYAVNLAQNLPITGATFFRPQKLSPECFHDRLTSNHWLEIPADYSAEAGKKGHFGRLVWTQFRLSQFCNKARTQAKPSGLIFSPAPEAPLGVGCRSVVMVHDLIPLRFPNWRSPLTLYAKFYVPQVLREAQHIVCNSQATADEIVEFFGIPARKITPIPLAYDAEHFRWLNHPQQNYFVVLGRPDPHKNMERILDAFAQISPKTDDTELWFVGPEDPRRTPELREKALALGVAERVKFMGYAAYADLPEILGGAIALVFPSLWEGFGLPVLEAMACGTPVITSNQSALPEVAGDAALLIDPENVEELAEAMGAIATDTTLRENLRQAGLERVQHFSWQKTAYQTAELLHHVAF